MWNGTINFATLLSRPDVKLRQNKVHGWKDFYFLAFGENNFRCMPSALSHVSKPREMQTQTRNWRWHFSCAIEMQHYSVLFSFASTAACYAMAQYFESKCKPRRGWEGKCKTWVGRSWNCVAMGVIETLSFPTINELMLSHIVNL